MAEEATSQAAEEQPTEQAQQDETVSKERYVSLSKNKKAAEDRAKELERQVSEMKALLEERENAGLPELERFKADLAKAQKRAEEAEAKAQEADQKLARSAKSNLVRQAAKNFADPDDAVAFVDLDGIEDERDAERAVKDLAKRKPHLLKQEEPRLPGKTLQNGQPVQSGMVKDPRLEEAEVLVGGLRQFVEQQK